jgi:ATP-dependent Lon protease
MTVIRLTGYTTEDKINIAQQFLIPKALKKYGLSKTCLKQLKAEPELISEPALRKIIQEYAPEQGVRVLDQKINTIARKTAARFAKKDPRSITDKDEINAFNTSVNSGDLEQAKLSVKGLMAQYTTVEGNEPRLVKGTSTGDAATVFRSTAELTAAMKDPRYKSDPAYRQDVIEKLGRSSIF